VDVSSPGGTAAIDAQGDIPRCIVTYRVMMVTRSEEQTGTMVWSEPASQPVVENPPPADL
jgi:hypothetical protein